MTWNPTSLKRSAGRLGLALGLMLCLTGAREARAVTATQIDEVMPGAFLRPEVQFVELRVSFCSGLDWAGKVRLVSFDADGDPVGEFVFPSDPVIQPCSSSVNSVLIGTQAFADLPSTPEPDFIMPPILAPGSGKVCFRNVPGASPINLCLTYGAFTGDTEQGSPGNAPAVSGAEVCALRRDVFSGLSFSESFNEEFSLLPPAPTNAAKVSGPVEFPSRFSDVPASSPFLPFVEALARAGVTGGCGGGAYCPQAPVTREQMAVFLLLAMEGPSYQPPACTVPSFSDVPCSHPFARWINELAARGITGGCGGGNYCPGAAVTREQMAVFLLLAMEGPSYQPPACAAPSFSDVPCSHPFARWINELAARGITGGCGGGAYCPGSTVTREQMAVFLSLAVDLPVPFPGCQPVTAPDDHGDTVATATLIDLPATLDATLERRGDVDVFAFDLLAGAQIAISAPHLLNGPDPEAFQVTFFGPSGQALWSASGFDEIPVLRGFEATQSGRYFLAFAGLSLENKGTYHLAIDGPFLDDHGDQPEDATALAVGGAETTGRIEIPNDVDVFSFPATAGQILIITATPRTAGLVPALFIEGPGGFIPSDSETFVQGDKGVGVLRAGDSGTYSVTVRATDGTAQITGEYGVRVALAPGDDHGNSPGSATPVTVGVPVDGFSAFNDPDYFSFFATPGQRYVVEVEALGGSLSAVLRGLNGMTALRTRAADGFSSAWLTLEPAAAGTYFVSVTGNRAGAYRVRLRTPVGDDHGNTPETATSLTPGVDTIGVLDYAEDRDLFVLSGVDEGEVYTITFTSLSPGLTVGLRAFGDDPDLLVANHLASETFTLAVQAPSSGDLFLDLRLSQVLGGAAYRIRVDGPAVDDHGNATASATLITPGAPALDAVIETSLDVDVFAFDAVAGQTFVLKAVRQPLAVRRLRLSVRGPDGATVLVPEREDELLVLTAPATGRYFLRVRSPEFEFVFPAFYEVAVSAPVLDDHGDAAATATPLTVDGPAVAGATQFEGDVDWFSFAVPAGEVGEALILEVEGASPGDDVTLALFAADGTTLLASDDDGGGGPGARIEHTPTAAGTLFARVRALAFGGTEAYEISVRREP